MRLLSFFPQLLNSVELKTTTSGILYHPLPWHPGVKQLSASATVTRLEIVPGIFCHSSYVWSSSQFTKLGHLGLKWFIAFTITAAGLRAFPSIHVNGSWAWSSSQQPARLQQSPEQLLMSSTAATSRRAAPRVCHDQVQRGSLCWLNPALTVCAAD